MALSASARRENLERRFPRWPRRTLGSHFAVCSREYAEALDHATHLARALLALGVERREHIAVLMANQPEYSMLKLAISQVSAVCVSLNTLLQDDELRYMLRQPDSKRLFCHQRLAGVDHAAAVRHVLTQPETHTLESAVCIRHAENLVGASFMSWEAFVAGAEEVSVETLKARRLASEYPDEVADIIYTSGTSGLP